MKIKIDTAVTGEREFQENYGNCICGTLAMLVDVPCVLSPLINFYW